MTLNLYKSKNYIILLTFIFLSILIIPEYKENGIVTILFLQLLLSVFIFSKLLKYSKWSLLIIIYPLVKFIYYGTYSDSWYLAGDFQAYLRLLKSAFSDSMINFQNIFIINATYEKFYFLTIINMFIPMKIFNINLMSEQSFIYLYFNDLINLVMISIIVIAYKDMVKGRYILYITLFLLYSPSYLAQTIYPDRHIFTVFALLLFTKGFFEFNKGNKYNFYLITSIIIIGINKFPLLFSISLYILIVYYINNKQYRLNIIILLILLFIFTVFFDNTLIKYFIGVGSNTTGLAAQLSSLFGPVYFVIMAPIKYIYAILSPFPWYKYDNVLINVGGSYLGLFITYFNSVIALSLFLSLFKYFKEIKNNEFLFKYFILFGIIMSFTIIPAHIGHYAYLALYFILFLPIFFIIGQKRTFIKLFQSFIIILILNIFLFIANF